MHAEHALYHLSYIPNSCREMDVTLFDLDQFVTSVLYSNKMLDGTGELLLSSLTRHPFTALMSALLTALVHYLYSLPLFTALVTVLYTALSTA